MEYPLALSCLSLLITHCGAFISKWQALELLAGLQRGKSQLAEERREIKDVRLHKRNDELTLFALGFLGKKCHYALHTGPLKDPCICGMRPPQISMQMNTMCTRLSLFSPVSPLSLCAAHRDAAALVLKNRRRARLPLSRSQPRRSGLAAATSRLHVRVARSRTGCRKGKSIQTLAPPPPIKKQLRAFPTDGHHIEGGRGW